MLEQGRGFHDVQEADAAVVKDKMIWLAETRKNMVDTVKKLDESMLALRAAGGDVARGGSADDAEPAPSDWPRSMRASRSTGRSS